MEVTFAQFCTAAPAAYEALRQQIDLCGQQGRSLEFAQCRMPEGCCPEQAALGFSRQGNGYLLYWRPAVAYRGSSRVLAALFGRSVWRFCSYASMTGRLLSLAREAGAKTYQPAPLQREPAPAKTTADAIPAPSELSAWPPLYNRLRRCLSQSVLGQEHAVESTAFRLYTHVSKQRPSRPLSLIFYGPTGVGKSELGKALAPALEQCCGRQYQFVWTELNTFTQPHSVHRLTGAPPGYVGYEDTPIFEAVRQEPYTVFMFDELEKAHPEVLKVFMSILDEGRCSAHRADEAGQRELDFRRCIFIFTSNADLSSSEGRRLGFADTPRPKAAPIARKTAASPAELAERLFQENESARQAMVRCGVLQEIAGRFSGLIGFHALDERARLAITIKQIMALAREYGLEITSVEPSAAQALAPGPEALSTRSAVSILEGVLTPMLVQAAASGHRHFRLAGLSGALRLELAYCPRCTSSTVLVSTSSR